eukprot:6212740-Pleurochrysis_carterae.AAC.7
MLFPSLQAPPISSRPHCFQCSAAACPRRCPPKPLSHAAVFARLSRLRRWPRAAGRAASPAPAQASAPPTREGAPSDASTARTR